MNKLILSILVGLSVSIQGNYICDNTGLEVPHKYLPKVTCNGDHIKGALFAKAQCKPRLQVVQLPWPNNTDLQQMTPTHIEIERCEGGCHSHRQSCVARLTRMKKIPVMLAKCGISVGLCDKECASVEVEEHLECGCECGLSQQDCEANQQFNKDHCACECKDKEAERECQESGRVWNRPSCSCKCPISSLRECSTGLIFDSNTCICIPVVGNEVSEQRIERSNDDAEGPFSWEIIIIGVLLSTLFLLLLLTISLARNLYCLQKRLKASHVNVVVPTTLAKSLYIPCSDPCKDLSLTRKGTNHANIPGINVSSDEEMSDRHTESSLCDRHSDRHTDSSLYDRQTDSCCDSMSDTSTTYREPSSRMSGHTGSNLLPIVRPNFGHLLNRSRGEFGSCVSDPAGVRCPSVNRCPSGRCPQTPPPHFSEVRTMSDNHPMSEIRAPIINSDSNGRTLSLASDSTGSCLSDQSYTTVVANTNYQVRSAQLQPLPMDSYLMDRRPSPAISHQHSCRDMGYRNRDVTHHLQEQPEEMVELLDSRQMHDGYH